MKMPWTINCVFDGYVSLKCYLQQVEFGEKSETGTGGMESKVQSALWALDKGSSVVICNGMKYNTIRKIMKGEKIGSFFTRAVPETMPVDVMAENG